MISTKGRYALRAMIDLAQHREEGNISLKSVAMRQGISKKYLEIIAKELVDGDLIRGASGRNGGYRLTREPEGYTVGEILELMEGTLSPVACLADKDYDCPRAAICPTLPMWKEFDSMIRELFYGRKLSDFLEPGTDQPQL